MGIKIYYNDDMRPGEVEDGRTRLLSVEENIIMKR